MKKVLFIVVGLFFFLNNNLAQSKEQINLLSISEATKYCSYKIKKGTGFKLKKIGSGIDSMHRNINDEYTEINNCSELKLGYQNETWEEISALEFCEKYFAGVGKNFTTKNLVLTKYPECIISETPFKLGEFYKKELVENNLVPSLNYEDNLSKIIEYIEFKQTEVVKNNKSKVHCLYDTGDIILYLHDCGQFGKEISYQDYTDYKNGVKQRPILGNKEEIQNRKNRNDLLTGSITREEYERRLEQLFLSQEIDTSKSNETIVSNKTIDDFTYCERSEVSLYYRIKDRGCLESDSEMSRGNFEYLIRNFDTIINCKEKDGVEKCEPNMLMSYSKENCNHLFTYNPSNSYTKSDREVLLYCRGPIDKKNYIFEENITAELDINESNNSSKKTNLKINLENELGFLTLSRIDRINLNGLLICFTYQSAFDDPTRKIFTKNNWEFDSTYSSSESDSFDKLLSGKCDLYPNKIDNLYEMLSKTTFKNSTNIYKTKKNSNGKYDIVKIIQKKSSDKVKVETNIDKVSLKKELEYWKELFEDELITQAEYDAKRKELLEGGAKVTQEATKNETKIVIPKNTDNIKTVTVDMAYKNKNYLNNSLLNQKRWSKISNYCDGKYKNFWEYQECEAQNTKAYKMYKKAKNIYDIYISYGELLSYQVLAGEISQQQARYYYESKRNELSDAYDKNKATKWNNFVDNMLKIQEYNNSLNKSSKPPSFNSHRTCTIDTWRGGTSATIRCH